jgi:hypothetical protein
MMKDISRRIGEESAKSDLSALDMKKTRKPSPQLGLGGREGNVHRSCAFGLFFLTGGFPPYPPRIHSGNLHPDCNCP